MCLCHTCVHLPASSSHDVEYGLREADTERTHTRTKQYVRRVRLCTHTHSVHTTIIIVDNEFIASARLFHVGMEW